jgi:iron complex outermembrane receptor protein
MKRTLAKYTVLLTIFFSLPHAVAQPGDLANLEIEDLMEIEVTSVSRREERVLAAPAAVFVLTEADIRRSGARTFPDLLRLVPGMHVAQSNGSTWAISARGFSDVFANKLLVMIDGRTVYSPIFSGTYWDSQDYVLEDIERIEVIRGPGGALWGANAVNGVINIITKSAHDTAGGLAIGSVGTSEQMEGVARFGAKISEDTSYRVYAKYREFGSLDGIDGVLPYSDWDTGQAGFRVDSQVGDKARVTFQGDVYGGNEQLLGQASTDISPYAELLQTQADFSGGNILGKVNYEFSEQSQLIAQLYFERANRASFRSGFHSSNYDVDVQHRYQTSSRNEFVYGAGVRILDDEFYSDGTFFPDPVSRNYEKTSAFLQDTYALVPGTLYLTVGSKLEHNEFTGTEYQPNARVLWSVNEQTSIWGAVSRAVRTPSRYEHDLSLDIFGFDPGLGIPGVARLSPNKDMKSEDLISYEIGLKAHPRKNLLFDLSLFVNDYDHLVTYDDREPYVEGGLVPRFVQPIVVGDNSKALTYGAEILSDYRPTESLRFVLGYSYLNVDIEGTGSVADGDIEVRQDQSPKHQVTLRTQWTLGAGWEFDPTLRYVDTIAGPAIDSYVELDARLGYRLSKDVELSLIGQNLLNTSKREFLNNPLGVYAGEVERGVLAKIDWRF